VLIYLMLSSRFFGGILSSPLFSLSSYLMKLDRITTNPNRMNGQPCVRNLRLTVRRVIE
jgi:hypothetical protein